MHKVLIALFFTTIALTLAAQSDFYDFENNMSGWQAGNSTIELTDTRFKSGGKSLLWKWSSHNATLSMEFKPHIVQQNSCFGMWLYNNKPMEKRLYVTFFNNSQKIVTVWYNLNFRGWRPLGINFGRLGISNNSKINKIVIQAPEDTSSGELFIDNVKTFIISNRFRPDNQQPWAEAPAMLKLPSEQTFYNSHDIAKNRPFLPAFIEEKNIPEKTRQELKQLDKFYQENLFFPDNPTYKDFSEVEATFRQLRIKEKNGIITGAPIELEHKTTIFLTVADALDFKKNFVTTLKKVILAYHQETGSNQDKAEKMFLLMCKHLLDQGYQEGNNNLGWIGNGYGYRHYPPHVFRMRKVLDKYNITDIMGKSIAWLSRGDAMMAEKFTLSCDDIYNYTSHLPGAVLMTTDLGERYQRMRALQQFYEKTILAPLPFGNDGTIHHHGGHHLGYGGYAPPTMARTQIAPLKDTEFRLSAEAQEKLRIYTRAISFQSTYGTAAPNLYMRSGIPIRLSAEAMSREMAKLDNPFDPEMAAIYLWELNGKTTDDGKKYLDAGVKPAKPYGHWTMNMSAIGMHRRADWMISAAGMVNGFRSLEIYGWMENNNYGRYSRNGSIFTVNHDDSGYRHEGWNWNFWPGATNVIRSQTELFEGYNFFGNSSYFAGGVTARDNGVWGMDFQGCDVHFKKSAFFFDNRITIITTNIEKAAPQPADSPGGETITTIFQQGKTSQAERIHINGHEINEFPYSQDLDGSKAITLRDGLGNGYYIWAGNPVHVQRNNQEWTYFFKRHLKDPDNNPCINMRRKEFRETPLEANAKYYNPTKGDFNLAYIKLGENPEQGACVYTLLPAVSPQELELFSETMKGDKPPVQIIQQDNNAHAVFDPELNSYGYVVFNEKKTLPESGPLTSINTPAFIMINEVDSCYEISIATSDQRFKENFQIRLKGIPYPLEIKNSYPVSTRIKVKLTAK